MQYDQASFRHQKGLLHTRNKLIAINKQKHYQSASQTVWNGPGFTAGWLVWLFCWWYFYLLLFFMHNMMDAAVSLHVLVYLEQKKLVRCCPQRQGIFIPHQVNPHQMSEGQMETIPLFLQPLLLQLYTWQIPTSHQAKIRGTNCSAKWLSRKHSHSQTVFLQPGKFQE